MNRSEEDVNTMIFGDCETSLTSILGINRGFREPHTSLVLLGIASGMFQLPEPSVKVTFPPEQVGTYTYPHPEITFSEQSGPIMEFMALGYNNKAISLFLGRVYLKVAKKIGQQFNGSKLPTPDYINARLAFTFKYLGKRSELPTL